jgi:uncharacterized protein
VKRCTVVFATPARQWSWRVEVAETATVGEALTAARAKAGALEVPWEADVGIFGELCGREALLRDGDRVEIYRPLKSDPKESRRARALRERTAARDPGSSRPRSQASKTSNR